MTESFVLRNVTFQNRVFTASGTFGYGDEMTDLVDVSAIGAIITKSLSLKPRDGNPPPRIAETAAGMLNSIGLANIGVKKFIDEKIPKLKHLSCTILANIAASSVEEYCGVLDMLESIDIISGYEINVSCPNVKEGGLQFGTDPGKVAQITRQLRKRTSKPLVLKLTPNVTRISEIALAAEAEGADAVSLINTLIGMAIDIRTRRPKLSTVTGGLSGPAVKPVALAKVYEVYKAVKIPIIGIGGVTTWEDAIEFFLAGATAVQTGTVNFVQPSAAIEIVEGIRTFCSSEKIRDVAELIGALDAPSNVSVVQSWL